MKAKIYYSINSGGDGSAYIKLMESKELVEIDQEYLDEGWGEDCSGWITIEHYGPFTVLDEVETVDDVIKETLEYLLDDEDNELLIEKLEKLKKLKSSKK